MGAPITSRKIIGISKTTVKIVPLPTLYLLNDQHLELSMTMCTKIRVFIVLFQPPLSAARCLQQRRYLLCQRWEELLLKSRRFFSLQHEICVVV